MSKFMIECPKCHRYNEASSGLFARRNILCSCGNIINVKNDKIVTRVCPGCGNTVVYDQSEGSKAKCPVCSQQLVADSDRSKMIHFPCHTCGCLLQVNKTASTIRCSLCGADNNVQEEVKKAQIREKGEPVTIEYRGDRKTLVWRHPMTEFVLGSQLIVREGQEAIFLRNGEALDSFGPGRHTLETPILPKLAEKLDLQMNGIPFRAEIYFVNMTTQFNLKWGTPSKVSFRDPETHIPVDIGASGGFSLRVIQPRKLLSRVVGTQDDLKIDQLFDLVNGDLRTLILGKVKTRLAQGIQNIGVSILDLSAHHEEIAATIREAVNEDLKEYGIELPDFTVMTIALPEDDPAFKRLKEYYINRGMGVREVELEADIKRAEIERVRAEALAKAEEKRILAQAEADAYLVHAKAQAEEMKEKGYTYQQETQRQVATAAMENAGGNMMAGGITADMMQLGMGMGAARQAAEMTQAAMKGAFDTVQPAPVSQTTNTWNCNCGRQGISSRFCPDCGAPKPEDGPSLWDCSCGRKGNKTRFCPDCGRERPTVINATWTCSCGATGITSKFCPECGRKRP